MDRIAHVYFQDKKAGVLSETQDGFVFQYDEAYLKEGTPLSFHFPLQLEPFYSKELMPFFDNLTSEGWLRDMQSTTQKVSKSDSFGLLLNNGEDLVGAVRILPADKIQ